MSDFCLDAYCCHYCNNYWSTSRKKYQIHRDACRKGMKVARNTQERARAVEEISRKSAIEDKFFKAYFYLYLLIVVLAAAILALRSLKLI